MMQSAVYRIPALPLNVPGQDAVMHLSPGIFITPVNDSVIVLDLARDKYLALNPTLARAALDLTRAGSDGSCPKAAREKLVADGILTDTPRGDWDQRAERTPVTPDQTLWPSDPGDAFALPPISPKAFASVLWALTQAEWNLKRHPFQDTVGWVSRQPVRRRTRRRTIQQLLDEFFAARAWFWVKPVCRLDALALCLHLRRSGCDAALVFGVKLAPFQAHCWVHAEDTIINEPHEVVSQYTPIMAV